LDIVDSSRFGDVLWMEGWTFQSKTLCRCHVVSFNDYYHYCLLLLNGDAVLNPGPVKLPCAVCHFPVRLNQHALSCDECGQCCHCKCCSVNKDQYQSFQVQSAFNWFCPSCLSGTLPFHDCSVLSSSDEFCQGDDVASVSSYNLPSPPFIYSFMKVAHLNCRSLLAKSDEVFMFMRDNCNDIMTLSETWLDESVSDAEVFSGNSDLTVIRRDRNRRGGGVAIVLSSYVRFRLCSDYCEGHVESLWIELFPGSKRAILLRCVYRSLLDYHFFDHLAMECEKALLGNSQRLVILNSDPTVNSSPQGRFLHSFMGQFNLHELVQCPTRVTATTSSHLDLILTNSLSHFQATTAIPCCSSDHHYVLTHFCARGISQCSYHRIILLRKYHKLDVELLDKVLFDDSWSPNFAIDDINICTEAFTIVLKYILDKLIPLHRLRVKHTSAPWNHSQAIVSARRRRDWLHRRALKSGDSGDWSSYRCRNKVITMTCSAKHQYLSNLASDFRQDSVKFWKHFNYLSTHSRSQNQVNNVDVTS